MYRIRLLLILVVAASLIIGSSLNLKPASAAGVKNTARNVRAAAADSGDIEIPSPKGGAKLVGTNKKWNGDPHSYSAHTMRLIRQGDSDAGWNLPDVLHAVWSANGKTYALEDEQHQIYVGSLNGPPVLVMSGYVTPALSPSGKLIAAQKLGGGANGFEQVSASPGIVVRDLHKGGERVVLADDVYAPFFIAENKLGFGSGGKEGVASLYMIQLANGKIVKLTNTDAKAKSPDPFPSETPSVSDDGRELLIKWDDGGTRKTKSITLPAADTQGDKSQTSRASGDGRQAKIGWSAGGLKRAKGVATAGTGKWEAGGQRWAAHVDHAPSLANVLPPQTAAAVKGAAALAPQSGKVLFQRPISQYKGVYQYFDHAGRDWGCGTIRYAGHGGTDFKADMGTQVYASAAGNVYQRYDGCANSGYLNSTCGGGFGNHVRVEHPDGRVSIYAHMMSGTPVGAVHVERGQYVGTSASSGSSNAPHVHFEVRTSRTGSSIDPYFGSCDNGGTTDWISQSAYPNGDVSYVSPPWWAFDSNGNFEGWSVFNISGTSVNNGSLFIDPSGGDPYAKVEPLYVDAASFPYIQIRMGSNALDGNGAIYFRTLAGDYSEFRKVTFQVNNCPACGNASYYYYSVYMGGNPNWNGTVTGLRLDPGENGQGGTNTDSIGIDFVRFSATP